MLYYDEINVWEGIYFDKSNKPKEHLNIHMNQKYIIVVIIYEW